MDINYSDNGKSYSMGFCDFNKLSVCTNGKRGIVARFENCGEAEDGCGYDFWTVAIERASDGYRYYDNGFPAVDVNDVMSWVWGIYEGDAEIRSGLEESELDLVQGAVSVYAKSLQKMAAF